MNPSPTNGTPIVEVTEKATRRRFTAEYKLRILGQYDRLPNGERGAFLRREGLYSSHIDAWRRLLKRGGLSALVPQPRGPKPNPSLAEAREIARLERENARLERRLKQAEAIIGVQKKVLTMFKEIDEANESGEKD